MSINMTSGDPPDTDYADFSYQHLDYELTMLGGDTSSAATGFTSVEPLQDSGGLQPNQVAELVGMRRYVVVEPDRFEDQAPETQGAIEFRGVFGVDVNSTADLVDKILQDRDGDRILSEGDVEDDEIFTEAKGHDKDEVLDHFMLQSTLGFEASADGTGAGAYLPISEREINFRDTVGAGPVLDANDDIGVVMRMIKNNVEIEEVIGHYRTTLIWDIAEISDAGRRFSYPDR